VGADRRDRRLPDVARWLTRAPATVREHRERFADPARLAQTLIVEITGGEVIGDLMLRVVDGWAQAEAGDRARGVQAELGWVLHPGHTGHGYATEAVRALIRLCFDDLGLRRVTAGCFAANEASWRLMERVGMRREAYTVRDALHRSGEWLDGMEYALLADEWRGSA
jgi:RimJ/RimL family protein N-acetyltransferase